MEKVRGVGVFEEKEVRGDDAIQYVLSTKSSFQRRKVIAIEVPHNEEISGG